LLNPKKNALQLLAHGLCGNGKLIYRDTDFHTEHCQCLIQSIVKFSGHSSALVFLCVQQPSG
jgi:formylmethanofuran dehydrogenase subunit E